MSSRYSDDRYGQRGSRGGQRGRGRSEQQGYEEERWRRNQEWSPSQDTGYQSGGTDSSPGSPYGYGGSGRGFESDADRFGSRSGDYPLGSGEGDFRSYQGGGQGSFGTGQYGYGGTGSQSEYGGRSASYGGYGSGEYNRREMNQSRSGERYGSQGGYGSSSEQFGGGQGQGGQFGSQGGYGSSSGQFGRSGSQQTSFRGRGPKGYTRSDQRIEEDVNERFSDDHYLDASNIEVSVQGGTVTLSGEVGDRESKRRAEDIAESCSGVQQVQNNLKVQGGLANWLFGNGSDESESRGNSASTSTQNMTGGASSKKAGSSGS